MDETATRRKKIDPALQGVGWEQVPGSEILTEQRAYVIAPGKVSPVAENRHPKKADYVLQYRGRKLAVIEAKSDETAVEVGIEQAKRYAELLHIRFTYAANGNEIYQIDMGVKDSQGRYTIPSTEGPADRFPSPQELWAMTYPDEDQWRDRFNLCPLNRGGGREPRYYQEIAIDAVLSAIARGQRRLLLTMATGTGKTYTAFQICWKLYQTGWNTRGTEQKPRILFIADRNILANQAKNDFEQMPEDAMERVTPELIHDRKHNGRLPTARHLYFTIFQTVMGDDATGQPFYKQWPQDFFDLVIIDECHRGGANDEGEWRQLMEWFEPAVQLGMTATPNRRVNRNTYKYFTEHVYEYSLKQGIEDGYLTPFRVMRAESNIDSYQYDPDDDVEGDIDTTKTYTEQDFYNGNIELRQRDEHRVKELLEKISPDDKTIVFCCNQLHALVIMSMINRWKRVPDANYCQRVTANDGKKGEDVLKQFQNNDLLRPTILTTSQKLSTGVDARNVRNIVLMRPVNNIIEFKQILGRGTRLFDNKYYFTLYDYVGASERFKDDIWDGQQVCPVCGNFPCSCGKGGDGGGPRPPQPPQPCPVCGNQPCTCPGNGGHRRLVVKLSKERELLLHTDWTEYVYMGDEMLTMEQYVKRLFGVLPQFLDGEDSLRQQWSQPETRQQLLSVLERSGFPEDKLEKIRSLLQLDRCDMMDVLGFLAYNTTPIDRQRRAEILRGDMMRELSAQQQEFVDFVLQMYVRNGFKELGLEKLAPLISMKYNSISDAKQRLQMDAREIQQLFLGMQRELYNGRGVVNLTIENHFDGEISQLTINGQ